MNNNTFPLSWKKCLLDAVVVDGRQGLTDCKRDEFEKLAWETIRSCLLTFTKYYTVRDVIKLLLYGAYSLCVGSICLDE